MSFAHQAEYLASVASGQHEYGLANALWGFERKNRELADLAWAWLADHVLEGKRPYKLRLEDVHGLRRHGFITREQFEQLRKEVEDSE